MYVSRADQSDRECSSRLCNDCTLKSPECVNRSWLDRWKREGRVRVYTIYYGIAGRSACVPSAQRRPPRISPPHCLLAGASLILLSWSIRRILRESKRLRGAVRQYRKSRAIRCLAFFTSPTLAAMSEMVPVAISAVGRGSPKPFGYCIPRVTEFSDGSEESVSFEQRNKLATRVNGVYLLF